MQDLSMHGKQDDGSSNLLKKMPWELRNVERGIKSFSGKKAPIDCSFNTKWSVLKRYTQVIL